MKDEILASAEVLIEAMDEAQVGTSALFRWLYAHYDQIASSLSVRRANWKVLSQKLGEWQILNGCEELPSAECVRQTWYRVRKTVERHRGRQQKSATTSSVHRPSPVMHRPLIPGHSAVDAASSQLNRLLNDMAKSDE
jgi:hypothetical protein